MIQPHGFPTECTRNPALRLFADEIPLDSLSMGNVDFSSFHADSTTRIRIESGRPITGATVRPLRLGIHPEIAKDGADVTFEWDAHGMIRIELEGLPALYLSASPPERPGEFDGHRATRVFAAGQIHEIGLLKPSSGERIWVEGGAVLRGGLWLDSLTDCSIAGPGLLWGCEGLPHQFSRLVLIDRCRDCSVSGLAMHKPVGHQGWCFLIGASEQIDVRGVSIISHHAGQDGIDVVGSRHVRVSDCLIHAGDDCIAVKALHSHKTTAFIAELRRRAGVDMSVLPVCAYDRDVRDVHFERCLLFAACAGGAMEIGYETNADEIRDIRFSDIDILGVHASGPGAVFSIHNGDRAHVHDITVENLRVEHHYHRLFDIQTLRSRWNVQPGMGRVSNISLRDIFLHANPLNEGYTMCLVGSCDPTRPIGNVLLQNIRRDGNLLRTAEELELFTRNAPSIHIE